MTWLKCICLLRTFALFLTFWKKPSELPGNYLLYTWPFFPSLAQVCVSGSNTSKETMTYCVCFHSFQKMNFVSTYGLHVTHLQPAQEKAVCQNDNSLNNIKYNVKVVQLIMCAFLLQSKKQKAIIFLSQCATRSPHSIWLVWLQPMKTNSWHNLTRFQELVTNGDSENK